MQQPVNSSIDKKHDPLFLKKLPHYSVNQLMDQLFFSALTVLLYNIDLYHNISNYTYRNRGFYPHRPLIHCKSCHTQLMKM